MLSYAKASLRYGRRHPYLAVVLAALLPAVGVGLGANYWAYHHYREAERALADDSLDEASRHIDACLRVWFRSPDAYFLSARIERHRGNYLEAEERLNRCIHLQGGSTEKTQLEGLLLRAQNGELEQVEAELSACLKENHPESSQILETLARIYMRESRLQLAHTCLNLWIAREPNVARAWHWRGWVLEHKDQDKNAIDDYLRAIELQPGRWEARLRLANLFVQTKNPVEALPHLELLYRTKADVPEVGLVLARCHMLLGDEDKAASLLESVLAAQPDQVSALMLRGKIECQRGHFAEGESWLRRALALQPEDPQILYELHVCLSRQPGREAEDEIFLARHEAVKADLQRLRTLLQGKVEQSPHDANLTYEIATLWQRLGNSTHAMEWFQRTLKIDPNHAEARAAVANYFKSRSETETPAENRSLEARDSASTVDTRAER